MSNLPLLINKSDFISPQDKIVISLQNDLAYSAYSFLN